LNNDSRTHLSPKKGAPFPRDAQTVGRVLALPSLGGLHHPMGGIVDIRRTRGTEFTPYLPRSRRGLDDPIEFDRLAGTEEALDACDASIRFTAPTEQLQACRGGPMKDSLAGGNWRSFVWVCIGIDALAV